MSTCPSLSLSFCRCSTPARSYLYDDMISQLADLQQLAFVDCKFHDIPRHAFRGLERLQAMLVEGANLLGHVDPAFAAHLPNLRLLEIVRSRVTFLPPLCGSPNLRTLNVSSNSIAHLDHAGLNCGGGGGGAQGRPLARLEILDVGHNHVSALPAWLGDSVPGLVRLSGAGNAVQEVGEDLCRKLPDLKFLDLSDNALRDAGRVVLANCTQLRILALGGNGRLGGLPAGGALGSMPYLQSLYLSRMGLSDNVWDKLAHLRFLETLELQGNALVTVPPLVLRELPNLAALNLSGNAIRHLPRKAFLGQYRLKVSLLCVWGEGGAGGWCVSVSLCVPRKRFLRNY